MKLEHCKKDIVFMQLLAPRLLSAEQAAAYLGLGGIQALRQHVNVQPIRIGRSLRYDIRMLDAWVDQQSGVETPAAEQPANDNYDENDEAFAASVVGGQRARS